MNLSLSSFYQEAADRMDDQAYMAWLYEKFRGLMFQTARKYADNPRDCEDIVQSAVIKIFENIEQIQGKEIRVVAGYIVTTIRNTAINYQEHQAVMQKHNGDYMREEIVSMPSKIGIPDEWVLRSERGQIMCAVMDKLSERDRFLLEGRYILEYSDEELAKQLGCAPQSIRTSMTRARRRAAKWFEKIERNGGT